MVAMTPLYRKTLLLLCALLLFPGCAGKIPVKEEKTDEALFNKAMELYRKKDYWQAKPAFTEVRDKFPLSRYAIISELRLGDIHYFQREYVEAINFYEEFTRLHPGNQNVPYAFYQLGMCYFKQIELFDRDQTPAEKAAHYFNYLIEHYPDSPFAGSAMGKYAFCRQRLFEHDFYIGHFYYKSKKYWAAKERFLGILSSYPYADSRDKVLYYLGKTYLNLNETEEARETFSQLLTVYPGSVYGAEAGTLLEAAHPGNPGKKREKKRFFLF